MLKKNRERSGNHRWRNFDRLITFGTYWWFRYFSRPLALFQPVETRSQREGTVVIGVGWGRWSESSAASTDSNAREQ